MPLDWEALTDAQLRLFLRRVRTRPLLALLATAPPEQRERLLALLAPAEAETLRRQLAAGVSGSPDPARRLLAECARGGPPCIFCQILAGEAEGSFIFRDAQIAAFMDLYPITAGHALIVPVQHAELLHEVPPETAAAMLRLAQRLAHPLQALTACSGYNLFMANGGAAGQDIFHVHLHVIPRQHGDGFGFAFPEGYPRRADRATLDAQAAALAGRLAESAG